ncbi:hypothetical protein [Variovorax ginsengisoli]|uniref:Uncharacterized protein n=1 Tax=Variovorax ginsengisoli TaxID=363844 RepID=A0ABT8SDD4_9BURK|nr:hypothetical protein [Variovorax ginsengisoli]MDN8616847.1 hypothetical protein [Variovorax ginsengisoli]MDO1536017.1 hypothetical protein [Variovorax ginsengisoli]
MLLPLLASLPLAGSGWRAGCIALVLVARLAQRSAAAHRRRCLRVASR